MALAVAFEDVKKNREKREAPGKTGKSTILFGSRDKPDFPHARFAEQDPGRYTAPHFHIRDQFQVVVGGKGRFGRHDIAPYGVHFTRAYTPYGPLISDAVEGLTFIVLRTQFDPGSYDVPDELDQLMRVPDRNPWHITRQAIFPELRSETLLQPVPEVRDDNGLAAYTLSMKPNTKIHAPSPASGDGQYVVVVKGSVWHENKEYRTPALIFVRPNEGPYEIQTGSAGLEALVLNFPRSQTRSKVAAKSVQASTGFKTWQCALCSFVYDEAAGMPEEGIPPGTRWQDVPETWSCPDCSASKGDFQMIVQEY